MKPLTVKQLAGELGVTRRTLERAMDAGTLVPSYYEPFSRGKATGKGHAMFSVQFVEEMKCRASEARSRGLSYVMAPITSTGTTKKRHRSQGLSARAWAQQTQWRRKPDTPSSCPEITLETALAQLVG